MKSNRFVRCIGSIIFAMGLTYLAAVASAADAPSGISLTDVSDTHQFIVSPGESSAITFQVRNAGDQPRDLRASFELVFQGRAISRQEKRITLAAGAAAPARFSFGTEPSTWGEADARLMIRDAGANAHAPPLAGYEQPIAVAGPEDIFVIFDKNPIHRGINFDDKNVNTGPRLVQIDGADRWIWAAGYQSQRGGPGWWHSFYFMVVDPKFQSRKRPALDIRVNYFNSPDAPVNLLADTDTGSRPVVQGWGSHGVATWQTATGEVDDARIEHTNYGSKPDDLKTDGYDFRFNSCTSDAMLKSIFVHGYDVDHDPDFHRLLRLKDVDAGRDLYIYSPGEKVNLKVDLNNIARVPLDNGDCIVRLSDDMGNEVWSRTDKFQAPASAITSVPIAFDTTGLKQGVYTVSLSVGRPGADGRRDELLAPSINVMVSEQSVIPKAKPGEFMYGCDTGVDYTDDRWMQWLDFMGVDIVRGCGAGSDDADWAPALAAFDKHHILNVASSNLQWDPDPARHAQNIQALADRAEARARHYGDRLRYWELGNEPDLTFFYPGPMDEYVKDFVQVSAAIRRGNPQAIVMNGGLSFASPDGIRRAQEFVQLVPSDAVQCFAYHGHGPLAQAERMAYQRIVAVARKWGKDDRPFMETESGVAAHSPGQIRIQARTAIEKEVYAQSVGLPTLLWFRLNIAGGDGDYTNTINIHEPRPCVLSYRTMAKTLKGLSFVRLLDLGPGGDEAYLFADKAGDARALVVWNETRGGDSATIQLGADPSSIHDVRAIDLFGNASPLPFRGATVMVPIEMDPAFITWRDATHATDATAALPAMLNVDRQVYVNAGADDAMSVEVRNPLATPLQAILTASTADSGITIGSARTAVLVPAKSSQEISLPLKLAADPTAVRWPRRWTVFAPIPGQGVDPRTIRQLPAQLSINGTIVHPQFGQPIGDAIDLAPLGGGFAEKREALLFATIDSQIDQTIHVGSSADWWEQWFVNGQAVYDDLETGNQGAQSILEHPFNMPLHKGKNLIAVRVLSGSQGWRLLSGGPAELASARAAATGGGNCVNLALQQGAAVLARARVDVLPRDLIPAPAAIGWDAPASAIDALEPIGELTEQGIVNEWNKQPDSSKWWHGPADLSGRVWVAADPQSLYIIAAVRDDVNHPAKGAADIDAGDSLRIAVATAPQSVLQLGIPAGGDGAVFTRRDGNDPGPWTPLPANQASAKIERVPASDGGTTWYRVQVSRSLIDATHLSLNVQANDDDFGVHKQSDSWFVGGLDQSRCSPMQWWQGQFP